MNYTDFGFEGKSAKRDYTLYMIIGIIALIIGLTYFHYHILVPYLTAHGV